MIGDVLVEKDFTVYQFSKYTKKLKKKVHKFRKGLPSQIKTLISKEKAQAAVSGKIIHAEKIIISPESYVFPFKPSPENPCWVVWHEVDKLIILTVIDAVTGKEVGKGISPPSDGFVFSGPHDYNSPCNPESCWQMWIDNAKIWFDRITYLTTKFCNPTNVTVESYVKNPLAGLVYSFGHGTSTWCIVHCNGETEYINASDVKQWMTSIKPKFFVFLGHCDGMCYTVNNSFSYEYRKGSTTDTTTVGYCRMSHADTCSKCWSYSIDWQDKMFSYIYQGYTVHSAFQQAIADYPDCANCIKFAGDENFAIPLPTPN
jgi:hypothetical protein